MWFYDDEGEGGYVDFITDAGFAVMAVLIVCAVLAIIGGVLWPW